MKQFWKATTFILFLIFLIQNDLFSQSYFASPLDIPISLSGTFGELRTNHFHSGLDIRTQGREGLPVKASADGYISRIKISPWGYGNALYLTHSNGYTTVYGHLSRFNPEIAEWVKKIQKERKTWEIQLFPNASKFQFKQGDTIAWSGNSGGSGGPHLHFEIRETKSEKPVHPVLQGVKIHDNRPPHIKGIKLYPLDENSVIKVEHISHNRKIEVTDNEPVELRVASRGNHYYFPGVEEICARGKIGIAVEVYDYHNGSGFRLGVYELDLDVAGETVYSYKMDKFSFSETRYVNAHMDYEEKLRSGKKYHRCFVLPGDKLEVYKKLEDRGIITVNASSNNTISLTAGDPFGNKSHLDFEIKYFDDKVNFSSEKSHVEVFPYNQDNSYKTEDISLFFPKGCFYDTIYFEHEKGPKLKGTFSSLYRVHNPYTPVQTYYTMSIKADSLPEKLQDKSLIVSIDEDDNHHAEGGQYANGYVTTKTRVFGDFYIDVDTVPPVINPVNLYNGKTVWSGYELRISIYDELSGIASYTPEIDGEWVIMAYDAKNDLLIHNIEKELAPGKHTFTLIVKDKVGNQKSLTINFNKK